MKRSLGAVLAAMVVLGLSSVGLAGQRVVIDGFTAVDDWLSGYTVRIVADSPSESAAAWHGSFDGPMNQLHTAGILDTPTLTLASRLGADEARDTHFLVWDADISTPPQKVTEPPPIDETNMYLRMNAAFAPEIQTQDFQLAHIAAPNGWTVNMTAITTDQAGRRWNSLATIVSGEGTWTASWEQDPSVPDGTVDVGQSIHVIGTPHHIWRTEYGVSKEVEIILPGIPGIRGTEPVANFADPEFDFVPNEPGTYTLTRYYSPLVIGPPPGGGTLSFVVVPEPVSLILLACGGMAILRRRGALKRGMTR